MTIAEILLIGGALSMDAFSVSLSSGMVYPGMTHARKLSMPVTFGIFQGIMPLAGCFLGYSLRDIISRWQGPISLIILGLIGANMIREGIKNVRDGGGEHPGKQLTFAALIGLAFATSIDAFAVGVSFAASGVGLSFEDPRQNVFVVSLIIAATTFVLCLAALALGNKAADRLGDRAEVLGGAILVLIGIKNMFF